VIALNDQRLQVDQSGQGRDRADLMPAQIQGLKIQGVLEPGETRNPEVFGPRVRKGQFDQAEHIGRCGVQYPQFVFYGCFQQGVRKENRILSGGWDCEKTAGNDHEQDVFHHFSSTSGSFSNRPDSAADTPLIILYYSRY